MDDISINQMAVLEKDYWFWVGKRYMFEQAYKKYSGMAKSAPGKQDSGRNNKFRLLDVGCGTGSILLMMRQICGKDAEIYGMDVSGEAIRICHQRAKSARTSFMLKVGNAEKLPYQDDYFDFVIISDTLEHVRNDKKAAQEVRRVLRPGGIALVTVPMFMHLWGADDKRLFHFRRYTKKRLNKLFDGFRKLRQTYIQPFFYFPALLARTMERASGKGESFEQKIKDSLLKRNAKTSARKNSENPKGNGMMLNGLLKKIHLAENWLIAKGMNMPIGVATLTVLQKERAD
ncbi:MAG: methyltransferase type 11 [archaeon GW2011_AR3]|nr:MAG: methyltransferase type 11 [archaeon GW2011_AR3]MBS3109609.1 class I SAM-dependent methyltransferase [Candidatus Woesearchaeota archaeon]